LRFLEQDVTSEGEMSERVLSLCDVLEQELVCIEGEGKLREGSDEYTRFLNGVDAEYVALKRAHREAVDTGEAERRRMDRLLRMLREKKRSALCFSGGGIRSATFCLGVLQGMAHQKPIRRFDYLSTVSGGGYIGSWLSSWLADGGNGSGSRTVEDVEDALKAPPGKKLDGELPQVSILREFSNYLSPRLGLLSADTWTLASTVFRNMFLNWLILVPLLAVALLVPYLALAATKAMHLLPQAGLYFLIASGFGCAARAVRNIGKNLPSMVSRRGCGYRVYLTTVLAPVVASAILMNAGWIGL
jgi:hypothetical protein